MGILRATEAVPLRGRVAIVTGGSAGIGLAAAARLSKLGSQVVIVGRTEQRIQQAIASVTRFGSPASVVGMAVDVTREGDVNRMAEETVERFGRIDLLVAAAGILRAEGGAIRLLADTPLHEWNEILDINLTGTFLTNRAVLPVMLEQRSGLIINVSSTSGRKGYAFDAAYCASKFGVIGLTEALAAELRPKGIRVHALLPGAIDTPMWNQNGPIPRPEAVLPVERVADVIGFLAMLPEDTVCEEVVVEPYRTHERPGWRRL